MSISAGLNLTWQASIDSWKTFCTDAVPVVATLCGSAFVALRAFWSGIDHNDGNTPCRKWRSHLASIHRTLRLSERHISWLGIAAIIYDEMMRLATVGEVVDD